MKTKYWVIVAIVVVLGLFFWSKTLQNGGVEMTPATRDFPVPTLAAVTEFDQVKGNTATSAKITIIEYSDFQCPACASYYLPIKDFLATSTDVRFVYRHFPLNIHFNAEKAAMAAEAAGLQGKFWDMHDKLFAEQANWSSSVNANKIFIGYAKELGLDEAKFVADLGSGDLLAKIKKDYESGVANGVASTPSFFVNGVKIENPTSLEEFQKSLTK